MNKKMKFGFIDAHADTITAVMNKKARLLQNDLHIDLKRLDEFEHPVVQVFAIYLADEHLKNAFSYANKTIDFFEEEIKTTSNIIRIAKSLDDIQENARNGINSAILALEGGEPLEGKLQNLYHFYDRGIRLITLTWNYENELGYGVGTESVNGLKPFGIEVVKTMNELGMIVDVSHLNKAGFWDVDKISKKPYIASHSNANAVTPHRRNLNDKQINAIIQKGGFIGINLYPNFIGVNNIADINNILNHINYFIEIGAQEVIGLGCDLDGVDSLPDGITDVLSLKSLDKIFTENYGTDISESIMSLNFYKFLKRLYN